MLPFKKVEGKDYGDIRLYTLSTCGWCKKTKAYLDEHHASYEYIDVDLLPDAQMQEAVREQKRYNPLASYPTLVLGGHLKMAGYDRDALRQITGD